VALLTMCFPFAVIYLSFVDFSCYLSIATAISKNFAVQSDIMTFSKLHNSILPRSLHLVLHRDRPRTIKMLLPRRQDSPF
jgi:hypothetical protein